MFQWEIQSFTLSSTLLKAFPSLQTQGVDYDSKRKQSVCFLPQLTTQAWWPFRWQPAARSSPTRWCLNTKPALSPPCPPLSTTGSPWMVRHLTSLISHTLYQEAAFYTWIHSQNVSAQFIGQCFLFLILDSSCIGDLNFNTPSWKVIVLIESSLLFSAVSVCVCVLICVLIYSYGWFMFTRAQLWLVRRRWLVFHTISSHNKAAASHTFRLIHSEF